MESVQQCSSERDSVKLSGSYGGDISNLGLDSDSDDDGINNYHSMLRENFSEDAKSMVSYHTFDPLQNNYERAIDTTDKQSVKSHFSTASIKSFHSEDPSKSIQTLAEQQSGTGVSTERMDYNKEKRKYMKQEARKIKQELKQEEQRMKKEKKELRDLDIDPDGKRRLKGFGKGRRKRLTKRTLELLAKKFDEFYAYENNYDFKGPKINIREIGQLFDMGNSTIHKLYTEWMEDPSFYERINRENMKQSIPERKVTLERL